MTAAVRLAHRGRLSEHPTSSAASGAGGMRHRVVPVSPGSLLLRGLPIYDI